MNAEILNNGKTVSFDQILKVLTGSRVKDLDAVYLDEDPEAVCMKVKTASGEVKYLQFGSDNDGHTDLPDERLEVNRFYMVVADPDPGRSAELTLDDLKRIRGQCAVKAMKYKKHEVTIRNSEMELLNTAPMADAYRFYFRVCMTAANALNEVIREREETRNGQV